MSKRASSGKRLRYEKQVDPITNDNLLVSVKMFSDGEKLVRVILNTDQMTFRIVDAVTGHVYEEGGDVTNPEVLLRKAKRHLKRFLDIYFEKEERNSGRFKK